MRFFADLDARIEALRIRASSPQNDAALLAEIEDLLAEGYIRALEADRRVRALRGRRDALTTVIHAPDEVRTIAGEERVVGEAAQALRVRLAVMHENWLALRASTSA